MELFAVYFFSIVGGIFFGLLTYVTFHGMEGDGFNGNPIMIILMIVFGLLTVTSLSPIIYEYPMFGEDTTVIEYADGSIIEHPDGAFCLEGNPRFFTVPSRTDSIWTRVQITDSLFPEPDCQFAIVGHVMVTDYQEFFRDQPVFEDYNEARRIVSINTRMVVDSVAVAAIGDLLQFTDQLDSCQQQACCEFINDRVNAALADRGLRYEASRFW